MPRNNDEDGPRDYGLPPRPRSPSILSTGPQPVGFFDAPVLPVINLPNGKIKKKDEKMEVIDILDDDDYIEEVEPPPPIHCQEVEVKTEPKQEPIDVVDIEIERLSDGDSDIEIVGGDNATQRARRMRRANIIAQNGVRQRSPRSLDNSSSAPSCPSSSRGGINTSPTPVVTGESLQEGTALSGPHNSVATDPNIANKSQNSSSSTQSQSQHVDINVLSSTCPQDSVTSTPLSPNTTSSGCSPSQPQSNVLVSVNGKVVCLSITVVEQDQAGITTAKEGGPYLIPSPKPKDSITKDSQQTGPSIVNGVVGTRLNDDMTQPQRISELSQTGVSLINGEMEERPNIDFSSSTFNINHDKASAAKSHGSSTTDPGASRQESRKSDRSRSRSSRRSSRNKNKGEGSRNRRRSSNHSGDRSFRSRSRTRRRNQDQHDKARSSQRYNVRNSSESSVDRSPPRLFTSPSELITLIRHCTKCSRKFATRRDGVDHQKHEHNLKHCPVCFNLLSCRGNSWKDHVIKHHGLSPSEIAKCCFCELKFNFAGMYQHIAKIHLTPLEQKGNSEEPNASRNGEPPVINRTRRPSANPETEATLPGSILEPILQTPPSLSNKNIPSYSTRSTVIGSKRVITKQTNAPSPTTSSSQTSTTTTPSKGNFKIPKLIQTANLKSLGFGKQGSASSGQSHELRTNGTSNNNHKEQSITAIHLGRLKAIYQNEQYGIPSNAKLEAISDELGVNLKAITTWFVNMHSKHCETVSRTGKRQSKKR